MHDSSRVLLIILDGFGETKDNPGNAITQADMHFLKKLRKNHPWTLLEASGNAVGLPEGFQGNSEVGHFTIGAGRITYQSLEKINQSIKSGRFFKMDEFLEACKNVREANKQGKKRALHLLGMISDEGVHSHINHLFALLELAKTEEAFPIYIHGILDGRDVPERSAHIYLKQIEEKIKKMGRSGPATYEGTPPKAQIATMVGRYYAMDRDTNWDRTQEAYDLIVHGKGENESDPIQALKNAYEKGAETDYYVPPIVLNPHGTIKNGDSVIFFNYRTDRARQLTDAFVNKKFDQFKTKHGKVKFVAMGPYTKDAPVAFPVKPIINNLTQVLSKNKIHQLRMAETEKYAHVTYFFNSQIEKPAPLEDRKMINSPKCPSYADKPEMSAAALTDELIKQIGKDAAGAQKYRFVAVNYANTDLVGHSGELEATIKCCKVIDNCLEKLVPAALGYGYTVLITSDHGNAEQMLYEDGSPCPAHTTNPIIALLVSNEKSYKLKEGKGLQDVSPTILDILGVEQPKIMTGETLIQH